MSIKTTVLYHEFLDGDSLWAVNGADQIFYKSHPAVSSWERIDGLLKQIHSSELGVFGVNMNDDIFYRIGTNDNNSSGTGWQQ